MLLINKTHRIKNPPDTSPQPIRIKSLVEYRGLGIKPTKENTIVKGYLNITPIKIKVDYTPNNYIILFRSITP